MTSNISSGSDAVKAAQAATVSLGAAAEEVREAAQQEASTEDLQTEQSENTMGVTAKSKKPEAPEKTKTDKVQRAQESVLVRKEEADSLADGFTKRDGNKQYHLDRDQLSRLAQSLGKEITDKTDEEEIIRLIQDNLVVAGQTPDVAQVDKTFDFLLEVAQIKMNATKNPAEKKVFQDLFNKISAAKTRHFTANQKDIETAQKIIDVADVIAEQTGREMPETLGRLRDIVYNPQDLSTKFNYYKSKGFTIREMKQEIDAVLHFVGARIKQQDVERGEMSRLIDETRTLQAILHIFRYFKKAHALSQRLLT